MMERDDTELYVGFRSAKGLLFRGAKADKLAHYYFSNHFTFPQSLIVTLLVVLPLREPTASIALTTS